MATTCASAIMAKHEIARDIRVACETSSVTDRLANLQTSGEAWKKKGRHSQVYDPETTVNPAVARTKTARGHDVRVMPSAGAHTAAGRLIEPIDYSEPTNARQVCEDSVEYASPADFRREPSADALADSSAYAQPRPPPGVEDDLQKVLYADLSLQPGSGKVLKPQDGVTLYADIDPASVGAPPNDSSLSLYDNMDYSKAVEQTAVPQTSPAEYDNMDFNTAIPEKYQTKRREPKVLQGSPQRATKHGHTLRMMPKQA